MNFIVGKGVENYYFKIISISNFSFNLYETKKRCNSQYRVVI